jgi:hypothetical protein
MEPTFEKLLVLLAEAGVQFVLIGGIAVTLHGYVRLTEDVDIVVERTPENVQRLLGCLTSYGEGFARELSVEDFADEEGAIRIVEESEQSQLDVFTRISGLTFSDLAADAVQFKVRDHVVYYASKAALLRLKGPSPREKDRLDVIALSRLAARPEE